jgi:hypothetical protein
VGERPRRDSAERARAGLSITHRVPLEMIHGGKSEVAAPHWWW